MPTDMHHTIAERSESVLPQAKDLRLREEPLLQRYSPHHECSLATAFSFAAHGIVLLLAFLMGALIIGESGDHIVPDVDNIIPIAEGDPGGGGRGQNSGSFDGLAPNELGEFRLTDPPDAGLPEFPKNMEDLGSRPNPLDTKELKRLEAKGNGSEGVVGRTGGEGPGSEGGKGSGFGRHKGDGRGDGKTPVRARRMERWIIAIPYDNGLDYLNKLANLQAVLAVPEGKDTYRVYDDLSVRPFESLVKTRAELESLKRIYWTLTDPHVITEVSHALRLQSTLRAVHIFLPYSLERELLKQELERAKPLTEEQLNERGIETTFRAERRGNAWAVSVTQQGPKPKGRRDAK
jgi:hypothetical protein